jgi:hypothetical protein
LNNGDNNVIWRNHVQVDDRLTFTVGAFSVTFTREDFCIITGMRFGRGVLPSTGDLPFQRRVFPALPSRSTNVKGREVRYLFLDAARFARLSVEDAVRVCLLMLVHYGFMGVQDDIAIPEGMIRLVEDLESWNSFPWGSYIWAHTHHCLSTALVKRADLLERRLAANRMGAGKKEGVWKYNLGGFAYAFRVCNLNLKSISVIKHLYKN